MPPTTTASELVVQVRAEMARQGLTLRELATRLGLPYATLRYRFESSTALRMRDLSDIAQVLQVPLSQLVERAERNAA